MFSFQKVTKSFSFFQKRYKHYINFIYDLSLILIYLKQVTKLKAQILIIESDVIIYRLLEKNYKLCKSLMILNFWLPGFLENSYILQNFFFKRKLKSLFIPDIIILLNYYQGESLDIIKSANKKGIPVLSFFLLNKKYNNIFNVKNFYNNNLKLSIFYLILILKYISKRN